MHDYSNVSHFLFISKVLHFYIGDIYSTVEIHSQYFTYITRCNRWQCFIFILGEHLGADFPNLLHHRDDQYCAIYYHSKWTLQKHIGGFCCSLSIIDGNCRVLLWVIVIIRVAIDIWKALLRSRDYHTNVTVSQVMPAIGLSGKWRFNYFCARETSNANAMKVVHNTWQMSLSVRKFSNVFKSVIFAKQWFG